jgi:hypothetical protein
MPIYEFECGLQALEREDGMRTRIAVDLPGDGDGPEQRLGQHAASRLLLRS